MGWPIEKIWVVVTKNCQLDLPLFPLLTSKIEFRPLLVKSMVRVPPPALWADLPFKSIYDEDSEPEEVIDEKETVDEKKETVDEKKEEKEEEKKEEEEDDSDEGDSWENFGESSEDDKVEEDKVEEDKVEEDNNENDEEEKSKPEIESSNLKEIKVKPVLHEIHSDMMNGIFGEFADNDQSSTISEKIKNWNLKIQLEDQLNKAEVKEKKLTKRELVILTGKRRRRRQNVIKDIQKYAASLVGGKTIPRDVLVAPKEEVKEKKIKNG